MDIKHFYIEKGEGEPLILLHGNGENCEYFEHQIETFSNKYHVYAIDTRGQGKTPRGDKEFSIRQFADDLAGFMDEHNIKKSHLLGFSDGGNIALTFSLKYLMGVSNSQVRIETHPLFILKHLHNSCFFISVDGSTASR